MLHHENFSSLFVAYFATGKFAPKTPASCHTVSGGSATDSANRGDRAKHIQRENYLFKRARWLPKVVHVIKQTHISSSQHMSDYDDGERFGPTASPASNVASSRRF